MAPVISEHSISSANRTGAYKHDSGRQACVQKSLLPLPKGGSRILLRRKYTGYNGELTHDYSFDYTDADAPSDSIKPNLSSDGLTAARGGEHNANGSGCGSSLSGNVSVPLYDKKDMSALVLLEKGRKQDVFEFQNDECPRSPIVTSNKTFPVEGIVTPRNSRRSYYNSSIHSGGGDSASRAIALDEYAHQQVNKSQFSLSNDTMTTGFLNGFGQYLWDAFSPQPV